jgi:Na+-driven multidrug efflux pump
MSTSALASAAPGALPPAPQSPALDVSYGRVIRVAAPMTLSTITGIVSQLAATGMIARIGGSALYVRSVYTPVAFLLIAVTTGLGVTLQVAVAQCRGRGDDSQIRRYFGGVARVGAVAYLVLGGVLIASVRLLDGAVAIAPDRQAAFRAFLIAMTGATLLGMLGELCSATLRGIGRTGIGALVTVSYVTCYLTFIAVAGLVLHGGLMAVAFGVALSGIIEISIGLAVLVRSGVLDLRAWTSWRPDVPRLSRC